ncbi:sulfite exporter TauE/SafE family protein, partial [Polynucleobacter paneuropaeus]|nr:sulfite exporter TauE/SafE family protein [Polynucleobacter paneuropaeus]MBT8601167.1 sulfite exporter TauE/SafE family protein [Polynucleobacter paneuropaeus]
MDSHALIIPALGVFVGLLMGLTGAGGGILSVPLLVFFVHLPVAEASPIALCAIALSATVGAIIGLKEKVLRYKAAIFMSIFGLIMSPIGLWVANKVPNTPLLLLFSAILIFVSV